MKATNMLMLELLHLHSQVDMNHILSNSQPVKKKENIFISLPTLYLETSKMNLDHQVDCLSTSGPISAGEYLMSTTMTSLSTGQSQGKLKQQGVPQVLLA